MYKDTGLIIPPFTYLNEIYRLPIFTRVISENSKYIKIIFDGKPLGKRNSFQDLFNFELEIKEIIKKYLELYPNDKVLTTISGGMDSSYLLNTIREVDSCLDIDGLCCVMRGLEEESQKARKIAFLCKANYCEYRYKNIQIRQNLKKFINFENDLVYDSVVPLISEMMKHYAKNNNIKQNILVFEGQGADTNLIGLPHNLAVELYNQKLSIIFRLLTKFIPRNIEVFRLRKRKLYRFVKMIKILGASSWQDAFLVSLGLKKDLYPFEYNYYKRMLFFCEEKFFCKHKSVMSFFQLILQVREIQKYMVLPKNFKVVLPFMDISFLKRCFNTPTNFFFSVKCRKLPLVKLVTKKFPKMFSTNKTTPFIAIYDKKNNGFFSDREIRDICIESIKKKLKLV